MAKGLLPITASMSWHTCALHVTGDFANRQPHTAVRPHRDRRDGRPRVGMSASTTSVAAARGLTGRGSTGGAGSRCRLLQGSKCFYPPTDSSSRLSLATLSQQLTTTTHNLGTTT